LASLLITARLASVSPFLLLVLQMCGVVTVESLGSDPNTYQVAHPRATIHWDALSRMFTDPVGQMASHYGWGTAQFDGSALAANISALVALVGVPARTRKLPRRVEETLAGVPVPEADARPATQLIASFLRGHEASGFDVGISLYPLRPTTPGGSDGGLGIS